MKTTSVKPKDQVIQYIRNSLVDGTLEPNTKLPAERTLAAKFNISRAAVREALKSLENFGIIKTLPQSGSVIVGLDTKALDGLLADILKLDSADFASLIELRVILEVSAARFCAMRRTEEDIEKMQEALTHYVTLYNDPNSTLSDRLTADFAYHRAIANGSKNSMLISMLMFITPEIITTYNIENICSVAMVQSKTFKEHSLLLDAIKDRDFERAQEIMRSHFIEVLAHARKLRERDAREATKRQLK